MRRLFNIALLCTFMVLLSLSCTKQDDPAASAGSASSNPSSKSNTFYGP